MANQTTFQIIAKALGFDKTGRKVKGLTSSMKKFAVGLVSVAAAYKALGVGIESIKLAAKLEAVEKGFDNLRKSAGFSANAFKKFDDALNGTVSRLDLMTQANNAMLLGIAESEDQMAEMFDVAQRLAEALGQDATFGINSLVTGLGRQSKLMLDNLGIMVDMDDANKNYALALNKNVSELTEQERKQGFVNEAMRQGSILVEAIGDETQTTARQMAQFTGEIDDFKLALGEALIESGAMDALSGLMGRITDFIDKQVRLNQTFAETDGITAKNAISYNEISQALLDTEQRIDGIQAVADVINSQSDSIDEATRATSGYAEGMDILTKAEENGMLGFEALEDELEKLKFVYDDLLLQLQNLIVVDGIQQSQTESIIKGTKARADARKSEAEATKKLNELKTEALALGMKEGQQYKTLADAATGSAQKIIRAEIQKSVAKYNAQITSFFAPLGPFAPAAIFAASSIFATGVEQMLSKIGNFNALGLNQGGLVNPNLGSGTRDDVPAVLTAGEYVMSRNAVESIGVDTLEAMNAGGGGASIVINNPIISSEFVETELPELIAEAVRKGANFGMS